MQFDYKKINKLSELRWYSLYLTEVPYSLCLNLFHYTPKANEKYIFKQDSPSRIDLRLTRVDHFTDESEGKHIVNLFRNTVFSMEKEGLIKQDYLNILIDASQEFSPICEVFRNKYVFCFSKDSDNQHLKEKFACKNNQDGIIIGFQAAAFESLRARLWEEYQDAASIQICDVIYNPQVVVDQLKSLIVRAFQLKNQDDNNNSVTRRIVLDWLSILCLAYKDKSFEDEQETRLILDRDTLEGKKVDFVSEYQDDPDNYYMLYLKRSDLYHINEVSPHDQL